MLEEALQGGLRPFHDPEIMGVPCEPTQPCVGRLRLRRLILKGRRVFASARHDTVVELPPQLRLLCPW